MYLLTLILSLSLVGIVQSLPFAIKRDVVVETVYTTNIVTFYQTVNAYQPLITPTYTTPVVTSTYSASPETSLVSNTFSLSTATNSISSTTAAGSFVTQNIPSDAFEQTIQKIWTRFWDDSVSEWNNDDNSCGGSNYSQPVVWNQAVIGRAITDSGDVAKIHATIANIYKYKNSNLNVYSATEADDDDIYSDDNAQVAWVMIDGYTATGNLEYLYSAQEIVDFLISQWNPSTGGVIWSYKQNYVASISTTESALAAMRLYSITQNSTLLNFAEDCMNFMFQYLQDPNDKLFYDGLDANDITNVNTGKLTYTVGTGISALSYMYKYTQNSTYLNQAISLGQAALEDSAFIDGIGMLNNKLEYVHLLFAGYADLFNNVQWQNEFEDLKTKILKQGNYIYNFLQDPDDSYLYYDSATGGTQKMFNDYEDVYPDNQVFTLDDSIYCNNDPNAATIKNLMDNASAAQILYELSRI